MIGIVLTGYGCAPSGMLSGLELTSGAPKKFVAVDFLQEDTTDDLQRKIKDAIASLGDVSDGVLICADPADSVIIKVCRDLDTEYRGNPALVVVAGLNTGALQAVSIAREYIMDLKSLAQLASEEAVNQIHIFDDWI